MCVGDRKMNKSAIANESFLHGKAFSPTSEKIVYATLDRLALKRTRLPLQLLPVDEDNVNEATEKTETPSDRKRTTTNCVNIKVNATTSLQPRHYAKCLVLLSKKSSNDSSKTNGETSSMTIMPEIQSRNTSLVNSIVNNVDISTKTKKDLSLTDDESLENNPADDYSSCESSSNYELIELASSPTEAILNIRETSTIENEQIACSRKTFLKSKSTNDLTNETSKCPIEKTRSIERFVRERLRADDSRSINDDDDVFAKKKRHFAKHVLRFVPNHLARRRKKTKKKKKCVPTSLNSTYFKTPITFPQESNVQIDSCRTRSLSRKELRDVTISSPTNFVHVASATNTTLMPHENNARTSLERITHEEKCATLPLLARTQSRCIPENAENDQRSKVTAKIPFPDITASARQPDEQQEQQEQRMIARKNTEINRIEETRKSPRNVASRAAKVLEQSQEVKTPEENSNYRPDEKLYESMCETSHDARNQTELRANSSFLWGSQAKCFLESRKNVTSEEKDEKDEDEDEDENSSVENYDDVGPVDSIEQGYHYDDVGIPVIRNDPAKNISILDSGSIYDTVTLNSTNYPSNFKDDYLVPTSEDSSSQWWKTHVESTCHEEKNEEEEEDHYLHISNEYSSVEEEETDVVRRDKQDVYDDVGLPCEERVNSLYAGSFAGSFAGSISGLPSANGKESEWEDLEDSMISLPCPSRKNYVWKYADTQVVGNKKKAGQRWSRKVKKQRSKGFKKNSKSVTRPITESIVYVAVSLGSGSVLLVGNAEKIEGEWSEGVPDDLNPTEEDPSRKSQGLVQIRIVDLDEDADTQEASCYVHEDNATDDSTYESLQSFQPDDFSTDSEIEATDSSQRTTEFTGEKNESRDPVIINMEAPTRPIPPPPREASLTQTLGKRIKMLRRTWSITKGSLGRMRRRTSVEEVHCYDENKETSNEHTNSDSGKYFGFARHFRKNVAGLSTFYLDGNVGQQNGNSSGNVRPFGSKDAIYSNTNWYRQIDSGETVAEQQIYGNIDHYSILAEQEPLYQFYAAAAARIAFDSDSDGYEEVEDMTPSQATTELAKPGHRTLWCQTPQVVNSDLLQRLTMEERKIQEAKFEILTSEASYLNSLRVLENEFLNDPTLVNEILTPSEKDKLFGAIPSVLQASEKFLAELETVWRQDPLLQALPDILLKYAEKCLDIYVTYCSNQVSIDTTLKELRSRKGQRFLEAVSQIETRPACQSLSLHSFLMLPMQRVTRMPLLTDAVLSKLSMEHPDRSAWERVLSSLSYIVAECNEAARAAAQEAEMEALSRKLEYSAKIKPVILKGRHLVRSGPVVQLLTKADAEYKLTFGKKFNKTPLYLLLLTDYLLVTKFKSSAHEETYTVIDTCKRNLIALESVSEESPFAGRNAMVLTLLENHSGHQVEYILTCENNTERERWLEAVLPTKRGLVGETLYEAWDCPQVVALYSYSPNQPDELSLQPGDVINVLRKMADGWYQGEKLLDGEQGWFPGNYTKEVASEHVRARNLKQRHRLLALSGSVLHRKAKQQSPIC